MQRLCSLHQGIATNFLWCEDLVTFYEVVLSDAHKLVISSGMAAVKTTLFPVDGCRKESWAACSACRSRALSRAFKAASVMAFIFEGLP
jgi:hypothetical protein